jgi:hypothetical protein
MKLRKKEVAKKSRQEASAENSEMSFALENGGKGMLQPLEELFAGQQIVSVTSC